MDEMFAYRSNAKRTQRSLELLSLPRKWVSLCFSLTHSEAILPTTVGRGLREAYCNIALWYHVLQSILLALILPGVDFAQHCSIVKATSIFLQVLYF